MWLFKRNHLKTFWSLALSLSCLLLSFFSLCSSSCSFVRLFFLVASLLLFFVCKILFLIAEILSISMRLFAECSDSVHPSLTMCIQSKPKWRTMKIKRKDERRDKGQNEKKRSDILLKEQKIWRIVSTRRNFFRCMPDVSIAVPLSVATCLWSCLLLLSLCVFLFFFVCLPFRNVLYESRRRKKD